MQRLDQFTFYPSLANMPGPALVFFSAVTCGACRHWKEVLCAYESEPGAIPVVEVDAGIDEGLAREFDVFHLPALFLFMNGEYHCPLHCTASLPALHTALAAALAAPAEEAP